MSRQVRYRVTALALGGFLLGVPLLINGTASADQVEGGGDREVVFAGGGVLGLSCRSNPDVEALTVPADSTVLVTNGTGHDAQLQLSGTTMGMVPEDATTEVVFHRGTTSVLLDPDCAFGDQPIPLLVTATPAEPTTPDPIPVPTHTSDSADSSTPPANSGKPPTGGTGSALPDSAAPPTGQRPSTLSGHRPGAVRTTTSRPAAAAAATAATSAAEAMPQGGSAGRPKTKIIMGTGTASPAFSGMPPGEHQSIVSGPPALTAAPASDGAPGAAVEPAPDIAAAEPVAAMQPLPESRPIGLLALTAIVCVIGVAVGAIRAFVSQRASRTTIA
jgi:hypothetical protein